VPERTDDQREALSHQAIVALRNIILISLGGIVLLSFTGLVLRYGVFTEEQIADTGGVADEALSILGNIAAAAIGGLVGWLTRDLVVTNAKTGEQVAINANTKMIVDPDDS